jgi:hypothetical protein
MTELADSPELRRMHAAWRALHSYFTDALLRQEEEVAGAIVNRLGGAMFEAFFDAMRAGEFLRVLDEISDDGHAMFRVEVLTDTQGWRGVVHVLASRVGFDQAEADIAGAAAWDARAYRELDLPDVSDGAVE